MSDRINMKLACKGKRCIYSESHGGFEAVQKDRKRRRRMLEKISAIVKEQLNLDDGVEITEETSFKDDLGADSLDLYELLMALEDEYGMEIPGEELEKLVTVSDVIELIKSKELEE